MTRCLSSSRYYPVTSSTCVKSSQWSCLNMLEHI